MKKMKKVFSFVIALSMMLSVMPAISHAATAADPFDMNAYVGASGNYTGVLYHDAADNRTSVAVRDLGRNSVIQTNDPASQLAPYGDTKGYAIAGDWTEGRSTSIVYSMGGSDITSFIVKQYTNDAQVNNEENPYENRYALSNYWIKVYLSADGKEWTQLEIMEDAEDIFPGEVGHSSTKAENTNWVEHLFWSNRIAAGYKYLKVEMCGFNGADVWCNTVGDVRVTYAVPNELRNATSYSQGDWRNYITSEGSVWSSDCSWVYKNAEGQDAVIGGDYKGDFIRTHNIAGQDHTFDATGLKRADASKDGYIVYGEKWFDINSFVIYVNAYAGSGSELGCVNLYSSEDGVTWTKMVIGEDYDVTIRYTKPAEEIIYHKKNLPDGIKFIKVVPQEEWFKISGDGNGHGWYCQVGKVGFDFLDKQLPEYPINTTDEIYSDDFDTVVNDDVRTFRKMSREDAIGDKTVEEASQIGQNYYDRHFDRYQAGRSYGYAQDEEYSVVYKTPGGDITSATVYSFSTKAGQTIDAAILSTPVWGTITLSTSPDGVTYTPIEVTRETLPRLATQAMNGWGKTWFLTLNYTDAIPAGTKYIKVSLPQPWVAGYNDFFLGKVAFSYETANGEPTDPEVPEGPTDPDVPEIPDVPEEPETELMLKTYSAPSGSPLSNAYDVYVKKTSDSTWEKLDIYSGMVSKGYMDEDLDCSENTSYTYFDFEGSVDVKVTYNGGASDSFAIRPTHLKKSFNKNGNTIEFTLTEHGVLSIEPSAARNADGRMYGNLQIAANPIESDVPKVGADNVIYFPKGYWTSSSAGRYIKNYFESGSHSQIDLKSGVTLYIAGGAVVDASLVVADKVDEKTGQLLSGAENVTIKGRGILNLQQWANETGIQNGASPNGILITDGKNIKIEGITVLNPGQTGIRGIGAENVEIDNVKIFTSMRWGDGINLHDGKNITIKNSYVRTSDDCISIYNKVRGTDGILVDNTVLWADLAHGFNIGTHGNCDANNPAEFKNIRMTNSHILDVKSTNPKKYNGAIACNLGDENVGRNMHFENISIENADDSSIINVRTMKNPDYNVRPGKSLTDVTFKDIYYYGKAPGTSDIYGYSDGREVRSITVENVVLNGAQAKAPADAAIVIGEQISDFKFVSDNAVNVYSTDNNYPKLITVDTASKTVTCSENCRIYAAEYENGILKTALGQDMDRTNSIMHLGNIDLTQARIYVWDEVMRPYINPVIFK